MYILISNNLVISGPREWSKRIFESAILDDLGAAVTLPTIKTDNTPIILPLQNTRILAVEYRDNPEYNKRTQVLDGPYWDFTGSVAVGRYEPRDRTITAVKAEMLAELAHNRWEREVAGTTVLLQGQQIQVTTNRGERDIFAQALLLGADGKTWKFDGGVWLTLSLDELKLVVNAISTHVSNAFVWESTIANQIEAATELSQLNTVDVTWPQNT